MGKFTIISDVGKSLVNMFKDQMTPEPISKPENIGVCDPKERGEAILGIHIYDTKESDAPKQLNPIKLPDGSLQGPPTIYEVKYMLSIVSKAEPSTRALDEQKIFGKLLQIIGDNKTIPHKYMTDSLKISGEEISIEMLPLELEEKVKIWTMFSEPYKTSVFIRCSPIIIESSKITPPPKHFVKSVQFGIENSKKGENS